MVRTAVSAGFLLTAILCFVALATGPCFAADSVFFIVRHAEKAADTGDPSLSPAGAKRAKQLMQTLEHLKVDSVFHTDTLRAKETALPLAEEMGIERQTYVNADAAWLTGILATQNGKRTLIVGHSNTVSEIAGGLSGQAIPAIGDHYDNLFIVVISDQQKSVVRLKYGDAH